MSTTARFRLSQYELMVESGVFGGPHAQRVELMRGEIREMSPIGVQHAAAVDRLNRLSTEMLPAERATVRVQGTLRVPALESAPEPDLLWLAPRDYFQGHPEPQDVFLLVEVAESSLAYDLGEKALLYAEAGIAEYWVVNLAERCLEVLRDPCASGYATRRKLPGDDEIRPLAFPDLAFRPSRIWRPAGPARFTAGRKIPE